MMKSDPDKTDDPSPANPSVCSPDLKPSDNELKMGAKSPKQDHDGASDSTKPGASDRGCDGNSTKKSAREEKLAAALRANLRRRKAPDRNTNSDE